MPTCLTSVSLEVMNEMCSAESLVELGYLLLTSFVLALVYLFGLSSLASYFLMSFRQRFLVKGKLILMYFAIEV